MRTLLSYLPALLCAGAMLVCFRMMRSHGEASTSGASPEEVAELREEISLLRAERALTKGDPTDG